MLFLRCSCSPSTSSSPPIISNLMIYAPQLHSTSRSSSLENLVDGETIVLTRDSRTFFCAHLSLPTLFPPFSSSLPLTHSRSSLSLCQIYSALFCSRKHAREGTNVASNLVAEQKRARRLRKKIVVAVSWDPFLPSWTREFSLRALTTPPAAGELSLLKKIELSDPAGSTHLSLNLILRRVLVQISRSKSVWAVAPSFLSLLYHASTRRTCSILP